MFAKSRMLAGRANPGRNVHPHERGNHPRTGLHRFTFYLVRLACIALLLALCTMWVSQWGVSIAIVFGLVTLFARSAPYDWI